MGTPFPRPIINRCSNNLDGICMFIALDEDGTGNIFETSQTKTDTPTLNFATRVYPIYVSEGVIQRIHFRLNPTNAVTYTLRLWQAAIANNYESNMNMLYESAAARADDTDYDVLTEPIPFKLARLGYMYYSVEWSAAPGDTTGFIAVSGVGAR